MAVPAALILAAIAGAAAQGYGSYTQSKAQEEAALRQEGLSEKQMAQQGRQFRQSLALQRKQQAMNEQASAINMLAGLEGLRQTTGKPTASQFLSQFAA